MKFDALLLVSFGGPEGPDDVMPFLQNVVRGRRVPEDRLRVVAEQYQHFDGVSPINEQNRRLIARVREALTKQGLDLPVYWGNRNWHPMLDQAVAQMRDDGVRNAAAFVTSAYSSYSSCRQYIEDIETARAKVGDGAPAITKLRPFFHHPGFVEPLADGLRDALKDRPEGAVLMTAHSLPVSMSDASEYERQLREVGSLVSGMAGHSGPWQLVFQSRSGPPDQPWLGPDVNDAIASLSDDTGSVIVVPIGFVSDHMEVVHDLDLVAARTARDRGIDFFRTRTPGDDPRFVRMVLDLVDEAGSGSPKALGALPPRPFPCEEGCCPKSL